MKVDNAINHMIMDILKNILSMAEKPAQLSEYITHQMRELIGSKTVALIVHNEDHTGTYHSLTGICPERNRYLLDQIQIEKIAEHSHTMHSTYIVNHNEYGSELEKILSSNGGSASILVPLEYSNHRVGLLILIGLIDENNIQSVIDSLNALSGVLALELRNAQQFQDLESTIVNRTKQLAESEKRFRSIIEQATDAMYLSDFEGNLIDVNIQACKSTGYSRQEMLRMNLSDLDATHNTNEKLQDFFSILEVNQQLTFESVHKRKDGSTFPVEISSSLIELDGKAGAIGFVRDISERKENELRIIRMGQHYQALIEKAPDGIVLTNADGSFKFISPSARKMFGYSDSEEITFNPSDFTHPEDLPAVLILLQKLIENPSEVQTLQYRFRDKNMLWRWVESTFSNLLADPGVEAIVINFHDITDRKLAEDEINKLNQELEQKVIERTNELENQSQELINNQKALLNLVEDLNDKSEELSKKTEQLQLANKELETFSYSVSHDLRAPLRAINGFVKILLEDNKDKLDEEGKRICNIIETNAMKMGQLIDDLLSFSRLGRSEIRQMTVDMDNLVQQTVSELIQNETKKRINFNLGTLPKALCDLNLIRQVWINLLSNAIKYSSLNEEINIQIGSSTSDNEIVYFVRDNGIGFDMNYAHKLFGVFQRLHNMKEFEGTGVGLAIVQQIVHRHGGRVWAEGNVGKGAIFYFSLPKFLTNIN